MGQGYSPEIANEIKEKVNEKGFILYNTNYSKLIGAERTFRKNLAESLKVNGKYAIFPAADDPTDPIQVIHALRAAEEKFKTNIPTIRIGDRSYPLSRITLGEESVKIHDPEETFDDAFVKTHDPQKASASYGGPEEIQYHDEVFVPYDEFMKALDSFPEL
jgi:hypothetical protein